jgi:hypothetical protein
MHRLLLILLAGALGGCAAPPAVIESADGATLSAASTFTIDPPPLDTTGAATSREGSRLRAAIEGEIVRSLGHKGYHLADPQSAQLVVAYRLASMGRVPREDREDAIAESRVASGPGSPYRPYQPLPEQAEGARREMLLLTIADRQSARIVWQATNEGLATSTASAISVVSGATRGALAKLPKSRGGQP